MDAPNSTQTDAAPRRIHLILKDGSYQLVLSYKVVGSIVRYRSAERNGAEEDVPMALVDLVATHKWEQEHADPANVNAQRSVLSPELAKEEADRAALRPEIAPDLRLPEEDSVLALDTFHDAPELVPVPQEGGDLNKETAHNVLKRAIDPAAIAHRILDIPGARSDIQLHVNRPVFYVRVGSDEPAAGGAMVIDTGGASGRATPSGGSAASTYVIERLDVRSDVRVVNSFRIAPVGAKPQADVTELNQMALPGGRWATLTPTQPLEPGEYALVEVLSGRDLNLDVWDFGVHPDARENAEAIHPEAKRPSTLERRKQ